MKFYETKVDMRVACIHGRHKGKRGRIVSRDPTMQEIDVLWDGDVKRTTLCMSILYLVEEAKETVRSPAAPTQVVAAVERKMKSPDDIDRERQYAFFATCTLPGCCPKCTAPLPCKYH